MTLEGISSIINFRCFNGDKEDIYVVRVYTDINDYFDIGLNTWMSDNNKDMSHILKETLLKREVAWISWSDEILNIHLEDMEYYEE